MTSEPKLHPLVIQANELMKRGETAAAAPLLEQVLAANPHDADALFLYAGTRSDPEQQREIIRRVLQLQPEYPRARAALEWLDRASASEPDSLPPIPQPARASAFSMGVIGLLLILAGVGLVFGLLVGRLNTPIPTVAASTPGTRIVTLTPIHTPMPIARALTWQQPTATAPRILLPTSTAVPAPLAGIAPVPIKRLSAVPVAFDFSREMDRLVYVSSSPDALYLVNPVDGTEVRYTLPMTPTSISVTGRRAAIGYARYVSYIDLEAGQAIKSYSFDFNIEYVLLSPLGWIYLPRFAINLETDELVPLRTDEVGGGPLYLHPDNQRIYAVAERRTPYEVVRLDLDPTGRPIRRPEVRGGGYFDSTDVSFVCQHLWLMENGRHVINNCGKVFRVLESDWLDMQYGSRLAGSDSVAGAAQLDQANRIVVVNRPREVQSEIGWEKRVRVDIYESAFFNRVSSYFLPPTRIEGGIVPLSVHAVFPASDARQYHLLVQIDESAGLLNNIGLLTRSLDDTPETLPATAIEDMQLTIQQDKLGTLPFLVTDAEYSKALDRAILIVKEPARLLVTDIRSGTSRALPLPRPPLSLSLSRDGRTAVVGHDALITLVDLEQLTIIKHFDIAIEVHDIALSESGWIYALPPSGRARWVRCLHLETGLEKNCRVAQIQGGNQIRLQPDGAALYYTGDGSSLIWFPIRDGLLGEGQAPGIPPCQRVWFSEGGERLLVGCSILYTLTPGNPGVLTEGGSLDRSVDLPDRVWGIGGLPATGNVVAVVASRFQFYFRVYSADSLQLLHETDLKLSDTSLLYEHQARANWLVLMTADNQQALIILSAFTEYKPGSPAGLFKVQ